MACLAFPPPSFSFLLPFFLLCFFFGGVFNFSSVYGVQAESLREKRENKALFVSCFFRKMLSPSFLVVLAEHLARGGKCFCFILFFFYQSCTKSLQLIKCSRQASITIHERQSFLVGQLARLEVFPSIFTLSLAGHLEVIWLP